MTGGAPLAELAGISVRYARGGRLTHGLIEVDLAVAEGETLAIVGESGCGKSTLGRVLLRLQEPSEGAVRFRGEDLTTLGPRALRRCRRRMQMIFQDPFASLNPRMTIGETLGEPLVVHRLARWRGTRAPVADALRRVGLDPSAARRYPHQFSGGQRQRIAIARAVIAGPELVVADEPLSALDISIQGQILALFEQMRATMGLTYVFVSHDLPVVRQFADRVAVMHGGRIVEEGPPDAVFARPAHPYTRMLVDAVPLPEPALQRARHAAADASASVVDAGEQAAASPVGCPFRSRCPHAMARCEAAMPPLLAVAPGRRAACWLNEVNR